MTTDPTISTIQLGKLFDDGYTFWEALVEMDIQEGSLEHRLAAAFWGDWLDEPIAT